MKDTVITSLGNLHRFSHELDSATPFMIFEGKYFDCKYEGKTVGDVHFDPQLFIILSGETDFSLDTTSFRGKSGDVFISNFWEPHTFRTKKTPLHFLVVTFSMFTLGSISSFSDFDWLSFMGQSPRNRRISFEAEQKQEILHLAEKIITLEKEMPPGYKSMQWFLIHEIMFYVNSKYLSHGRKAGAAPRSQLRIFPALELIWHNPNCEIPLEKASSACSMSRSTFCDEFKKVMNESFSHFAMRKRIGYSCMLLRLKKFSIKEVSDRCGFKNIAHFYHVFRKTCQCTPLEFIAGDFHVVVDGEVFGNIHSYRAGQTVTAGGTGYDTALFIGGKCGVQSLPFRSGKRLETGEGFNIVLQMFGHGHAGENA